MPLGSPTSLLLTRTGRQIPFKSLAIGEAFCYAGTFWTRTDTHTGTDLRQRCRTLDGPPAETFGSCAFGINDAPQIVEAVTLGFQ